jgi:hypothetical protein
LILFLKAEIHQQNAAVQKNEDGLQSEIDNEDIKIKIAAKQEEIKKKIKSWIRK